MELKIIIKYMFLIQITCKRALIGEVVLLASRQNCIGFLKIKKLNCIGVD